MTIEQHEREEIILNSHIIMNIMIILIMKLKMPNQLKERVKNASLKAMGYGQDVNNLIEYVASAMNV